MLVINLTGELQAILLDSTVNPAMVSQAIAKAADAMANEAALVDWRSRHVSKALCKTLSWGAHWKSTAHPGRPWALARLIG